MRWLRHRKALQDRDAGLVFAWRGMNSGLRRKVAAGLVVVVCGVSLAVAVRVRVVPPVPVGQREASVMIATEGEDFAFLLGRLDESSPFPARFETRGLAEIDKREAAALAAVQGLRTGYQPQLRELPKEPAAGELPALVGGQRVFPPLPKVGENEPAAVVPVRLTAELVVDSADLAARVVVPVAELGMAGDTTAAGRSRRYLVEVRADGSVGVVVPLEVADAVEMPGVEDWLRRLRFEVAGGGAGWHSVEARWVPAYD